MNRDTYRYKRQPMPQRGPRAALWPAVVVALLAWGLITWLLCILFAR